MAGFRLCAAVFGELPVGVPGGVAALVLAALLLQASGAAAQVEDGTAPPETESRESPIPAPRGQVYTWKDGDRTLRAFLQADLVVTEAGVVPAETATVATAGDAVIVRVAEASREAGRHPVFRSPGGGLMTLPGGVLLVLDRDWGKTETDAFFARNGIAMESVSPLGALPNGFTIATEPGFASLELANALAELGGVLLASPNWWREHETR